MSASTPSRKAAAEISDAVNDLAKQLEQQRRADFAAAALTGLVSAAYHGGGAMERPKDLAEIAWAMADAMMDAEGGAA